MPASALPCPAGRSIPSRGGPERHSRPRPDGTGASVRAGSVAHRDQRARAVTNGQQWRRGTAGQRAFNARSLDNTNGRISLWSRRSGVGVVAAADGQQPVSVTTRDPTGRPWRIMTTDPASRRSLTWRFSTALMILNTTRSAREGPVRISHGGGHRCSDHDEDDR